MDDDEANQYNPYMLKGDAHNEFGRSLQAKSNYSFGGRTPMMEKRKNSAMSGSKYIIDKKGVMRMAPA